MSLSPDRTLGAKIMAGAVVIAAIGFACAAFAWAIEKIGDLIL